jgi:pilus assembly protein CpaF
VISRLETMVLMAGFDLPSKNIRQQISSAINLIVHLSRLRDGTRRVVSLTEISGMEGDTVVMSEIFRFEQKALTPDGKVIGELKPTGIRPMFSDRLEAAGFRLGGEFFGADLRQMLNNKPRR